MRAFRWGQGQRRIAHFKASHHRTWGGCSTDLKPVWSEVATWAVLGLGKGVFVSGTASCWEGWMGHEGILFWRRKAKGEPGKDHRWDWGRGVELRMWVPLHWQVSTQESAVCISKCRSRENQPVFKTKGKGKKTFSKSIQITGDRVRNVLFLFGWGKGF